jgi:hypothetical protein
MRFRLIPFRSPLLGESRLIFFPRGTEMCQFPRLPTYSYVFTARKCRITGIGFTHSEIRGSKAIQRLSAAYRSRSRPSSASDAKASTVCPSYLDGDHFELPRSLDPKISRSLGSAILTTRLRYLNCLACAVFKVRGRRARRTSFKSSPTGWSLKTQQRETGLFPWEQRLSERFSRHFRKTKRR